MLKTVQGAACCNYDDDATRCIIMLKTVQSTACYNCVEDSSTYSMLKAKDKMVQEKPIFPYQRAKEPISKGRIDTVTCSESVL